MRAAHQLGPLLNQPPPAGKIRERDGTAVQPRQSEIRREVADASHRVTGVRRLALGLEANLPPIVAEAGGKSERVRQLARANPGEIALTQKSLHARTAALGAT